MKMRFYPLPFGAVLFPSSTRAALPVVTFEEREYNMTARTLCFGEVASPTVLPAVAHFTQQYLQGSTYPVSIRSR